jgi:predicted kinase
MYAELRAKLERLKMRHVRTAKAAYSPYVFAEGRGPICGYRKVRHGAATWRNEAAAWYAASMKTPHLIVMSGLPGSGKSTIAERLAERLRLPLLSVDPIESAILRSGIPRSFATGLAAYLVAEELAGEQLKLGNSVVIDAVNAEEEGKDVWRGLASKYGLALTVLQVIVSDREQHKRRIELRERGLFGFSEVTWDQVEARERVFTAWRPSMSIPYISRPAIVEGAARSGIVGLTAMAAIWHSREVTSGCSSICSSPALGPECK